MEPWDLIAGFIFCLGIAALLLGIWLASFMVGLMGIILTFAGFASGILFGDWELNWRL